MRIRHLFLPASLLGLLVQAAPLSAQAQAEAPTPPHPPAASAHAAAPLGAVLSLAQVLQAARQNPDVLAAQRAAQAARADVRAADRAPAPVLSHVVD